MTKKNALLVLGGGAAFGLAHIGVIAAVEKQYRISGIIGTSMGAIVGALYSCGYTPAEMLEVAGEFRRVEVFNPLNLDFSLQGIFDGKTTLKRFQQWTDDSEIELGKIPFMAVAYDLYSSNSVLIDRGSFASAMRASSSVPYIYAPYSYGKYLFVDGGVEHPLPLAFKDQFKHDICIAVNVLPRVSMQAQRIDLEGFADPHKSRFKSHQVFLHSTLQNQGFIAIQSLINHKPDIIIDAWNPAFTVFDLEQGEEFYKYGYKAATHAMKSIDKPDFFSQMLAKYQQKIEKIILR